jgi:hypothetical protein
MDGIARPFLGLVVVLVFALMVAALLRRRRLGADRTSTHCPHCETPMSMRRVSRFKSLSLLAGWECPHCGTRGGPRSRGTGTAS